MKNTGRHPTIDSDMSSEIKDDDGVFIPHNTDRCRRRLNPNLVSTKADPPQWVKSYLVFPSAAFQAWVKLGNLTPALMTSYSRKTSSMYTLLSRKHGPECRYAHNYILGAEHYEEMKINAKKSPCPTTNRSAYAFGALSWWNEADIHKETKEPWGLIRGFITLSGLW